jgi:NADH-quinone oxidoreductase subunit H
MLLLLGIAFKIVVVASVILGAVAYLIYVERKIAAFAQDRIGPNTSTRRSICWPR